MLKSLFIRNFVLIEHLDIQFDNGFSVITGETGAGKSIILGALSLVLGQRADGRYIKNDAEKCIIETVFDISKYTLEPFFDAYDLEYDAETCILRRELFVSGKSRAFINDSPVSLSILKELGNRLIDIHSQHQNLLLGDNHFQLRVVDIMAGNEERLSAYHKAYSHHATLTKTLQTLTEKAAQLKQEEDYIQFQLKQLEETSLSAGEQEMLEQELETLTHVEEIKNALYKIAQLLNGEEQGAVQLIKEALSTTDSLGRYYPQTKEIAERLRSAYIDLNDLAAETDKQTEHIEFDPGRMNWINERLNLLYSLEQKHHVASVEELIELQNQYAAQLHSIDTFDEQIRSLQEQLQTLHQELLQQASQLSKHRKAASQTIVAQLIQMITPLGMPNIRFTIEFKNKPDPEYDGTDEIQFLFSANKQGTLQPVSQTASGGEISRLMLCIKAIIAGFTALPTIVFDEIDTGISGDIADKMGNIMQELGNKMQVFAITHLPQIAAKGKNHYFVYKKEQDNQTVTCIKKLNSKERIKEIARMLSGASLTDISMANAKELLGIRD